MNVSGEQQRENSSDAKKRLSGFAGRLLAEWHELRLPANDVRAVVAVSGGADSVGLLLALAELIKTSRLTLGLTVAHLDHGLREEAGAADASWVAALAAELGFETALEKINVGELAAKAKDNLEQAARVARYGFLHDVAVKCGAGFVLTGHTMDDQAETVLLRLLRGSGAEGLSGMRSLRALVSGREDVLLARPLLRWARRAETEMYCAARGVQPRIDAMNADERFSRVRVRRQLVPLLETFNPRAVEAISRASGLLHEDASALDFFAGQLLAEARETCEVSEGESSGGWPALRVEVLRAVASSAVRRRALRQWIGGGRGSLRRVESVHLVAIENLLVGQRGGRKSQLPGGAYVERRKGWLRFYAPQGTESGEPKS
ncbi:MAG: tRNA lysidine(34) synthetase TilS [Pyrinomonadaceae bacterium]